MITSRRSLFGFGAALIAAPAIVRVASIMPVSVPKIQVPSMGIFAGEGPPKIAAAQGSIYLSTEGWSRAYINTDGHSTWTPLGIGA